MRLTCLTLFFVSVLATGPAAGLPASQCRAPLPAASSEANIFTHAQENDLGDAVAERFENHLRLIEDESLNAGLRRIGERLVAHLPQTDLRITFRLIDIPDANAFILPGGRVFVSRKLVGLTRSEDELAGVLGHELGHLVARQQTIAITRQLREILNVTSLGDRKDVFDKYNRLMENAGRKPGVFRGDSHENADQLEADRLGLFIVAAAGYNPRAHADLFDRYARTDGKTGGFVSRLFGTTSPDARRLAELLKTSASLPAGCSPDSLEPSNAYGDWRLAVMTANPTSREEQLPGLIRQTPITPFRDRIQHARFSPDGRYVLVQDDASVSVLERQPFAFRFRIPARDALPAEFSPDSSAVVFHTNDLRVERWSVAGQAIADVFDLHWPKVCLNSAVSPDGRTVACIDEEGHFTILDAASGRQVFQRKSFYQVSGFELLLRVFSALRNARTSGDLTLQFSPSGQYVAAGYTSYTGGGVLVYDVTQKAPLSLKDSAKRVLGGTFTFIAGDRILGLNGPDPARSGVVQLPGGSVQTMALPLAHLDRSSQSKYALMRPFHPYLMGVFDLSSRQTTNIGWDSPAVDIFDDHYVTDTGVGEIGLYALEGKKLIASVALEPSPISAVRTAAVSPDFRWLTLAGTTRGAVWDLTRQLPVAYMRDFDGAFIEADGVLYADFPDAAGDPRSIKRFDARTRQSTNAGTISAAGASQYGPWLVIRHRVVTNPFVESPYEYQVRDVRKMESSWTVKFDREAPNDYWLDPQSDALALVWNGDSAGGRVKVGRDERLRNTVNRGDLKGDFVVELLDAATGTLRGRILVETGKGSFELHGVVARGDLVFVTDSLGRVIVYTISSGQPQGYVIGETPVVSADGSRLAVGTGRGRISIYDVKTMTRLQDLKFRSEVAFSALSQDGASLFALTSDQIAHVIAVKK